MLSNVFMYLIVHSSRMVERQRYKTKFVMYMYQYGQTFGRISYPAFSLLRPILPSSYWWVIDYLTRQYTQLSGAYTCM